MPVQTGGQAFRRQWRRPQQPQYNQVQLPYITGLAGGAKGYFTDQYGNPRLVWGDAAWALCGNAGRWNGGDWKSDYDAYLATRAAQGFTVIYGKPMGTTQSGNIDDNGGTFDGLFPFKGGAGANPSTGLTEAYWQRIDYYLASAKAKGITAFFNAVGYSSDFEGGPGPLAAKSAAEFTAYGTALGNRYKNQPNIVWVLADDYFGNDDSLLDAFLAGARAAGDAHAVTVENSPETTSRLTLDGLGTQQAWGFANAQFNFVYSYQVIYFGLELAYTADGTVPVIAGDGYFYQGNPGYSGGTSFAWDRSFRQEAWWALTSGARGKVHGSENVWTWTSTSQASAAQDWWWANNSKHTVDAFTALAGWQGLLPDTLSQFVTAGRGTHSAYTTSQYESAETDSYVTAAITPDRSLAIAYLSHGSTITVNTSLLGPGWSAQWMDPVSGALSSAGAGPTFNSTAKGNNSQADPDWVLVFQGPAVNTNGVALPQPGGKAWQRRYRRTQQLMTGASAAGAPASASAGVASVSVAAASPVASLTAAPGAATVPAAALAGQASAGAMPGAASSLAASVAGTTAAAALSGVATVAATALAAGHAATAGGGVAVVVAAAPGATVNTSGSTSAVAGVAAVSAAAAGAAAAVTGTAGVASVTATALAGITAHAVVPAAAVVTSVAPGATASASGSTNATAGVAAVLASAPAATAAPAAAAGVATSLAAASGPSLVIAAHAAAAAVLAQGVNVPPQVVFGRSAATGGTVTSAVPGTGSGASAIPGGQP